MTQRIPTIGLLTFFLATAAQADDILTTNNGTIRDFLCVGGDCTDSEEYFAGMHTLRLKDGRPTIDFVSTSTSLPNDWRIEANADFVGGGEYFGIVDMTTAFAGNMPFRVAAGARENALYVAADDRLGLGTSLPQSDIHVVSTAPAASLRLEEAFFDGQAYELRAGSEAGFVVQNATLGTTPLTLMADAPTESIFVREDGDVGLGYSAPEGKLHTYGQGVQLVYFESWDGDAVQVRFRTDSENRRFLAVNNANEVKSQIIFLDDRINFTGETDSGANLWLSIGPDGIVSQGPDCGTPCDAVFDPEVFEVPDIKARAAQMWAQKHLPAIGPTKPHAPINLTEKMGGVIHELEVAHIYIEKLHERLEAQQALMAAQSDRFRAMEARLKALEATR